MDHHVSIRAQYADKLKPLPKAVQTSHGEFLTLSWALSGDELTRRLFADRVNRALKSVIVPLPDDAKLPAGEPYELCTAFEFLDTLHPGGPYVLSFGHSENTPDHYDKPQFHTATYTSESGVRKALENAETYRLNVYCYHAAFAAASVNKKPADDKVSSVRYLLVDVDRAPGEPLPDAQVRTASAIRERIPKQPLLLWSTGNGHQALYKFDRVVGDIGWAKRAGKSLNEQLGGDDMSAPAHAMRLAGTRNYRTAAKAKKGYAEPHVDGVLVEYNPDAMYVQDSFSAFAEEDAPDISVDVDDNDVRTVNLAELHLPENTVHIIKFGSLPNDRCSAEQRLYSRSEWLFRVCCDLVRARVTDQKMFRVLMNLQGPLRDHLTGDGKNPVPTAYALRQIAQAKAETLKDALVFSPARPLPTAEHFFAELRPTLLNVQDEFMAYCGGAYRTMEDRTIEQEVQTLLREAKTFNGKELVPFPVDPANVRKVSETLRTLAHRPKDTFAPPCWLGDDAPFPAQECISFPNGILHVPSGDFLPPTPNLFTLNALEFDYEADATEATEWLVFLHSIGFDDSEVALLQEWFGYILTPDTSQQKILLLLGDIRSGKGTIGRISRKLVGEANCAAPSLNKLADTFARQNLIGKLLAVVGDMRIGSKVDKEALVEFLLQVSGDDTVDIERKFLGAWTGKLNTRFMLCSNVQIKLFDNSGALANRCLPLVLKHSFLGREDLDLERRLLGELPAILNWALVGYRRLREQGRFSDLPEQSRAVLHDMTRSMSGARAFLEDEYIDVTGSKDDYVEKDELYRRYLVWAERGGIIRKQTKEQLMASIYEISPSRLHAGKGPRPDRVPVVRGLRANEPPVTEELPF